MLVGIFPLLAATLDRSPTDAFFDGAVLAFDRYVEEASSRLLEEAVIE